MDEELLVALKALADPVRLRIVGLLAWRPYALDELCETLLLQPSAVVRHLERLDAAGLVATTRVQGQTVYRLQVQRLGEIGRLIGEAERETAGPALPGDLGALSAEDQKVLKSFFADGRLKTIPAQETKRILVLRYLLDQCFEEGRSYPEAEVNERLGEFHEDVASLRRYLVDQGFMTREQGRYRRV